MSKIAERAALLQALRARNYHFITPTPATQARVLARADKTMARDLRDVFGWSLPFTPDVLGLDLEALLKDAGGLAESGAHFASRFRVASLGEDLLLHSAYPTVQADAVFFGPDSYRFAAFLRAEQALLATRGHIVDIGAGAGVGAITAARAAPNAYFTLTDINPYALELARANWLFAGLGAAAFVESDALDGVRQSDGPVDCIIANPPYIIDGPHRAYRDGGGMHGAEVSLAWAEAAAEKLTLGGALLLYTGSAIIGGEDRFEKKLRETLRGFDISYRELDPDVFGEELERDAYADVERIAVAGVVAVKR